MIKSQILRPFSLAVFILAIVVVLGQLSGCAGKDVNKDDPESVYSDAEESFKDEHYIAAIEKYRDLKNRFPYSSRAVDSELRIADTHFEQENYLEAESAYEIFKELHPTHSKIDYVQYRIGMSYYNQIPGDTARDLSAAYRAIDAFQVLIDKYSSSEFVPKARELIADTRKKLAEHENYVANFYFQREHYLSASYRYAAVLQEYPGMGYDEEALYRLGKCYYHVKMFSNAQDAFKRLFSKFPETKFKGEVQSLLEEMSKKS